MQIIHKQHAIHVVTDLAGKTVTIIAVDAETDADGDPIDVHVDIDVAHIETVIKALQDAKIAIERGTGDIGSG